jgi:replicative DNA helicase
MTAARIIQPRLVTPRIEGRVPPHDLDAEAAVLSTVLLKRGVIDEIRHVVRPEDCYSDQNARIYQACLALSDRSMPIDVVQVAGWLQDRGWLQDIGGTAYLAQIADATPSVHNVEAHAKTVAMKARIRRIISEAHRIAAEGYGDIGDPYEWMLEAERSMSNLADESGPASITIGDALRRIWAERQREMENPETATGVTTGLRGLDEMFGVLRPKRVTVVGGYWGDGKTALGLQMLIDGVLSGSMHKTAGLAISAEMGADELAQRALFSRARVDSGKMRADRQHFITACEWQEINRSGADLSRVPIWIDDRADISAFDIRSSVRRHVSKARKCGMVLRVVLVDYLQLIRASTSDKGNREQEVATVSRMLKVISKESDVHVLALAQLNDDANKRTGDDKKPTSRDFRESKAIAMNADNVVLIHNPIARERARAVRSWQGFQSVPAEDVELIVDKHRGGPTGTIEARFFPALTLFGDR